MSSLGKETQVLLTDLACPSGENGALLKMDEATLSNVAQVVAQASARVNEVFRQTIPADREGILRIQSLIDQMWREGWNPGTGDIDLFVRDFGALAMRAFQQSFNGQPVFRSRTDLSNASLWWPLKGIEVFPFRKVYCLLVDPCEEKLVRLWDRLSSTIDPHVQ